MVPPHNKTTDRTQNGRNHSNECASPASVVTTKATKSAAPQKTGQTAPSTSIPRTDIAGLKDYQLGDCLGKGASGSVYKALNWGTGETVAIKQVKAADLPKSDLRVIMLEIDLLKNLNHPNIVKYHGFVKSTDSLYIILEYCENGSLHNICKNFGKFPESLVALYMSQVLHGLLYLHEQGVIHRDVKGANILTTKEGLVKLADFGVATKAAGLHESSVVGTPYWMAPEVIELSGATTASDIWSLGCTVIELLDGKPPYHKLQPMPALFRIVNDDHPPLPESASPTVQDFLMQCFQKDPNLRVSARKLLKHPWIVSAKRADAVVPGKPTKYDEAVKSVQQWNEALESPKNGTLRSDLNEASGNAANIGPTPISYTNATNVKTQLDTYNRHVNTDVFRSPVTSETDNWDDDFASSISLSALQLPHLKPVDNFAGMLSAEKLKAYASVDVHTIESISDNDNDSTVRSPLELPESNLDPLETVRPPSPAKTRTTKKQGQIGRTPTRQPSQPKTQILRGPIKPSGTPSKPKAPKRSSSIFREDSIEDYSDLIAKDDVALDEKFHQVLQSKKSEASSPHFTHVSDIKNGLRGNKTSTTAKSLRQPQSPVAMNDSVIRRTHSSVEFQKYADKTEDEDFSDIFGNDDTRLSKPDSESGSERGIVSVLNSKFSTNSWLGDDEDEDDPFAQLEENLNEMDIETKLARDKHVRLCSFIESLVSSLKTSQPDDILAELSEQLMQVVFESPDMKSVVITSHGLLPILEVLDNCERRDVSLRLLKVINLIIQDNVETTETLCFINAIPIVTKFAHKKYSSEIRLEAAAFVRQMYQTSTLTLQMFVGCGGLNVLVEFVEEDYEAERDLVIIGVNGVWSVFELGGAAPKSDFCRIFSRSQALYPLSMVLNHVLDEEGELSELVEGRIANIFLLFSQAENHVKENVADRSMLKRVLKDLKRMSPTHQITMLKFIKNLSMLATTLESLQNSNAIETLTDLLSSSMKLPHFRDLSNQILNIMFNLCRLSKTRQQDAAESGIVPLLQHIVKTDRPLKEFALPILCDMAHSSKVTRTILWQNKGLHFYISLLADPYWQVTALDAIFVWLQEETAKVEGILLDGAFRKALIDCFLNSKADSFENLLEPLQKLLRLSPPVAATLAHPDLFSRIISKLHNKRPVVRGNLLRIIRSICDASEEQGGLIRNYGLYDAVERLAESDPAILVRNMASDLIRSSESNVRQGFEGGRYRQPRRTSSSTMTPPSLYTSSQPGTPSHPRHGVQSPGYFDMSMDYSSMRPRTAQVNGTTPYRPVSREGTKVSSDGSSGSSGGVVVAPKSRLPRTNGTRAGRPSVSHRKDENMPSVSSPVAHAPRSNTEVGPARRRQTGGSG